MQTVVLLLFEPLLGGLRKQEGQTRIIRSVPCIKKTPNASGIGAGTYYPLHLSRARLALIY